MEPTDELADHLEFHRTLKTLIERVNQERIRRLVFDAELSVERRLLVEIGNALGYAG